MTLSRKLNRKFRAMKFDAQNELDPDLAFTTKWVDHLVALLKKHRDDKEFVNDVFFHAMEYFKNNMSEQERIDVFAMLLRKAVIGK